MMKLMVSRYQNFQVLRIRHLHENIFDKLAIGVADPFIIKGEDNIFYIFFEIIDHRKGTIGFATSSNGKKWTYQGLVLEEPFHLSYPSIYKYKNRYYMIPESSENNSVRIYKAKSFPDKWMYYKTILEGKPYSDPTLIQYDKKLWLFVTDRSNADLYLYYSNDLEGPWLPHIKNPVIRNNNKNARPGGNLMALDHGIIRFAQDDSSGYGKCVRMNCISRMDTTEYEDHELNESPILSPSGYGWKYAGMHHLSHLKINNNKWLVAADGKNFIRIIHIFSWKFSMPNSLVKAIRYLKSKNITIYNTDIEFK